MASRRTDGGRVGKGNEVRIKIGYVHVPTPPKECTQCVQKHMLQTENARVSLLTSMLRRQDKPGNMGSLQSLGKMQLQALAPGIDVSPRDRTAVLTATSTAWRIGFKLPKVLLSFCLYLSVLFFV